MLTDNGNQTSLSMDRMVQNLTFFELTFLKFIHFKLRKSKFLLFEKKILSKS